jgi:leucine dehydrogenase
MSYKAALANVQQGGGKAVIIGDPKTEKTPEKMRAFGRFVKRLNGLYITAEDMGTTLEDMSLIHQETNYVVGLPVTEGGSGDPSYFTAYGVLTAIKACVYHQCRKTDLSGIRVAIQGLGQVGMKLAKQLQENGASLIVADINETAVQNAVHQFGAQAVLLQDIFAVDADVFAPCAFGGILNDGTIPSLRCKIVAGSANNQLAKSHHAQTLQERGILYAPDYLINAGGLINASSEGAGYDPQVVKKSIENIYHTILDIFEVAKRKSITTQEASDQIAEHRFLGKPL